MTHTDQRVIIREYNVLATYALHLAVATTITLYIYLSQLLISNFFALGYVRGEF